MSILRKNAIIELITWLVVIISFFLLFFIDDGYKNFINNSMKKTIAVFVLFTAYFIHFFILWSTNRKKKQRKIIFDERDNETQKVAMSFSFIFTLIYVFIASIILYEVYHDSGFVPVVFFWFMAYTTIAIASFLSALLIIITDLKNS